jgi:hypothetical protein
MMTQGADQGEWLGVLNSDSSVVNYLVKAMWVK